ncbi:D-glycero-beta-D-manno-heptose 1,7-bisphosphate 7-phosphatase [Thorsellia anophelis]|uniref:D,D-heptose 1,7-bisphosphate phosphatase n=1 Tax=Thorsellia anophelis DSM 18579 TaxID=1123402 RepID=A0A1I0BXG8_9GAMM|nr:D-glycero-beta-D-manno-heptose 1,7-bisphosphate 7-phosphatase [Thorsellia anophelis]SET11857.1 D-glycero-D-manno-heptose 1,7-bisphosphate phosphatase [Thorsellia anophelis DSM 18579]
MKPAIFLDRDGTLNLDKGYVHKIDDFKFFDGVIDSLKKLQEMDYLLVLVTNQSGIARGLFSESDFIQLTEWMDWSLADRGVNLDGIYYCPHHKDSLIDEYCLSCDCRKPKPGMLLDAAAELEIDLSKSIMVGDKIDDLVAAFEAGINDRYLIQWEEQKNYNRLHEVKTPKLESYEKIVTAHITSLDELIKLIK